MTRLSDKAPIYFELYEAIAHFVGRQQLVVQAVIDQGVAPKDLTQGVAGWHGKTPSRGKWGQDWWFGFHGGGCLLKNLRNGEPINWNGPDSLAFDPLFFVEHLEWRLANEGGLPMLRAYVQERDPLAVIDLIKELIADKIISRGYHLVPTAVIAAKDAA